MNILTGVISGAIFAALGASKSLKEGEPIKYDKVVVTIVVGAVIGGLGQVLGISSEELGGMQFSVAIEMAVLYAMNKIQGAVGMSNLITKK